MAEDTAKRSRWRKNLFSKEKDRERDEDLSRQTEEKLHVNSDVMDFLAPSIAKSQAMQGRIRPAGASPPKFPKIDIAAAQRWPGANDIAKGSPGQRSGGPLSSSLKGGGGFTGAGGVGKKKRKKAHLKVAFVKTEPEVIGEGGDEAELPTIAVGKIREQPSQQAFRHTRDDSDAGMPKQWDGLPAAEPPGSAGLRRAYTVSHENTPPVQHGGWGSPPAQVQANQADDDIRPGQLKRTATGWSEIGDGEREVRPSMDSEYSEDSKPTGLKRSATGFSQTSDADREGRPSFEEEENPFEVGNPFESGQTAAETNPFGPYVDRAPRLPEIDIVASESPVEYRKSLNLQDQYLPASPQDPSSFSARLIHKMRAEEGRVLHEAVRHSMVMDESPQPSISSGGSYDPFRPASSHSIEQPSAPPTLSKPKPPMQSSFSYQNTTSTRPPQPLSERPPLPTITSYPPPPQQQQSLPGSYPQDMPRSLSPVPAHMSLTPRDQSPASLRMNSGNPTPSPHLQPTGGPSNYFPQQPTSQPHQQRPPISQTYSTPSQPQDYRQLQQDYEQLQQNYQQLLQQQGQPQQQSMRQSPLPSQPQTSQYTQLQPPQQQQQIYQPSPQQPQSNYQRPPLQVQPPPSPRQPFNSLLSRVAEAANSLPSPTVNSARTSNSSLTPPTFPPSNTGNNSPASTQAQSLAGDVAVEDFTERVQHMSGIFRLTAEVIQPAARYTPKQWLRCALWWFLRGRAGLEGIMRRRARDSRRMSPNDPRQGSRQDRPSSRQDGASGDGIPLYQAHVDLAKVVWMLQDVFPSLPGLQNYTGSGRMGLTAPATIAAARDAGDANITQVLEGVEALLAGLKMLLPSCAKNGAMPPHASLIQGQDQSIWVQYPPLSADIQAIVRTSPLANPTNLMPPADTKTDFAFGRMFVNVTLSSPEERSQPVPCLLNILRERNTWGLKVIICSQSEAISVCIQDEHERSQEAAELSLPGPGWKDVTWDTQASRLVVNLPNSNPGAGGKFGMMIEVLQPDFGQLVGVWNYTRGVASAMMAGKQEKMLHEVVTAALQLSEDYDPSVPQQMQQQSSFPTERVKRCRIRVFERYDYHDSGTGRRKLHRGYRVLAITSPKIKNLNALSVNVGDTKPVVCEMVTENAGGEARPALILKSSDGRTGKLSTLAMTLYTPAERQALLDIITGIALRPGESVLAHTRLSMFGVEGADQAEAFSQSGKDPLRMVRWQDVMVIGDDEDGGVRSADDVQSAMSDRYRIVVRGNGVIVTERLNIVPGDLKVRLPATGSSGQPSACISILRNVHLRPSTTMICVSSQPSPQLPNAVSSLLDMSAHRSSLETFHFPTLLDLHNFQMALCSHRILFDGLSSGFTISHRRAMVPVHKRQAAHDVRVQVIKRDGDTSALLLAFFEQFALTEAMAFKLLSTDQYEKMDGGADGRGRRVSEKEMGGASWGVKLIDAKFALPGKDKEKEREKNKEDGDGGWKKHRRQKSKDSGRDSRNGWDGPAAEDDEPRKGKSNAENRFVCVDLLEYPGEHDDIVIGFEEESERDSFLDALPAAPQVSRSITFKRKI